MTLEKFLEDEANFKVIESLFFDRLSYDLKLSAVKAEIELAIFRPEVDIRGYDVIIDDADWQRPFQLKTVAKSSGTKSWKINKRLLRPTHLFAEKLGFEHSPTGVGLGGGVILTEFDIDKKGGKFRYFYTDIFIVLAFYEHLIIETNFPQSGKPKAQVAERIISDLHEGVGRDKLNLPKAMFVEIETPDQLLAIGGFHSVLKSYSWFTGFAIAYEQGLRIDKEGIVNENVEHGIITKGRQAADGFLNLVKDDLKSFS